MHIAIGFVDATSHMHNIVVGVADKARVHSVYTIICISLFLARIHYTIDS